MKIARSLPVKKHDRRVRVCLAVGILSSAMATTPSIANEAGLACTKEHSARVDGCQRGSGFMPCYKDSVVNFSSCVRKLKSAAKAPAPLSDTALELAVNSGLKPELLPHQEREILAAAKLRGIDAAIGARSLLSTFLVTDAQKIAALINNDPLKAKSLAEMVSAASLIEQLALQFKKETAEGEITQERRAFYVQWIGELHNKIDHRLHLDFTVEVYNEQHRDGSVRAKNLLDAIGAKQSTITQTKRTNKLIDLVRANDTYFKSLRLDEANEATKAKWESLRP